ncbi:MAG: 16S rRNA (uracil(1498)-N(3))-methyltransferase [Chitinophagales bacterium]|nr:16S rRNA (uracil(1498)-N(3))-methyltransferase [Chitinophagales bacterium]
MNMFYCPQAALNEYSELDVQESHHLIKVLRKKPGEELYVFDGKGNLFDARIETIGKTTATIHIVRHVEREEDNRPKLHVAIAPPKNVERFEWLLEKVTEIGVSEITPLLCKHSERKELRIERLEKILVSACKQSAHLTLPKLNTLIRFEEFTSAVNSDARKYIAYCHEKSIHLKDAYHGGFDAIVLIGPEGDFTKEEVLLAEKREYETVSLGKSRLRLETAAVYASVVFNLVNED